MLRSISNRLVPESHLTTNIQRTRRKRTRRRRAQLTHALLSPSGVSATKKNKETSFGASAEIRFVLRRPHGPRRSNRRDKTAVKHDACMCTAAANSSCAEPLTSDRPSQQRSCPGLCDFLERTTALTREPRLAISVGVYRFRREKRLEFMLRPGGGDTFQARHSVWRREALRNFRARTIYMFASKFDSFCRERPARNLRRYVARWRRSEAFFSREEAFLLPCCGCPRHCYVIAREHMLPAFWRRPSRAQAGGTAAVGRAERRRLRVEQCPLTTCEHTCGQPGSTRGASRPGTIRLSGRPARGCGRLYSRAPLVGLW